MEDIKKRVIVTGGAGFIGSHLTEYLIEKGFFVVVLDNLSTGRQENLEHLDKKCFEFHKIDISKDSLEVFFKDSVYVFHLAALADIVPSVQKPIYYHNANVNGTLRVLEASKNAGIKKFVYTASSSCYGIPDNYPTEESAQIRVEYPYALTKNVGEQYVMHWSKVYDLPVNSLRLFNVYGPRSRTSGTYGAVFGVFLAQKLAGENYTVVGDGTQTRDFVFVKDVVAAFFLAAESDVKGEIFNVGTSNPQSVNKLVDLLGGDKTYIPKRPAEPDCTCANIDKITSMLGWKPKVSFEEGVKVMVQNIDYWKQAPVWNKDSIAQQTKDWFKYLGN